MTPETQCESSDGVGEGEAVLAEVGQLSAWVFVWHTLPSAEGSKIELDLIK